MEMSIEEAITRFKNNAEYERTHGNLHECIEFRQLAEWLEQLQKIEQIIRNYDAAWELHHMKSTIDKIREAIEDDK